MSRELTSANSAAETPNLPVSVSKFKEKERAGWAQTEIRESGKAA